MLFTLSRWGCHRSTEIRVQELDVRRGYNVALQRKSPAERSTRGRRPTTKCMDTTQRWPPTSAPSRRPRGRASAARRKRAREADIQLEAAEVEAKDAVEVAEVARDEADRPSKKRNI